ncbi:hypothetical protein GCM10012287_50410 [Streptomyces daqingensis]|uniref:Formate-dependent nitrite reductase complex subunit NrfF n=1 Tax=Streptomyces daqingensis TaxID=1472640 RepID=A0ABQ2MPV0_9ACTN|nr:hypothetical protein GCM10012287_50410 [Streptomyces daqingensis]
MEDTVVQCAEGHVFSTSTFPMQNLGEERIGRGRLLRCPRCARLRQAVPVSPPVAVPPPAASRQARGDRAAARPGRGSGRSGPYGQ